MCLGRDALAYIVCWSGMIVIALHVLVGWVGSGGGAGAGLWCGAFSVVVGSALANVGLR